MKQDPIYAFQLSTLQRALEDWKMEQIEHYPHQHELIETVVLAMNEFLQSNQVRNHKMVIDQPSDSSD